MNISVGSHAIELLSKKSENSSYISYCQKQVNFTIQKETIAKPRFKTLFFFIVQLRKKDFTIGNANKRNIILNFIYYF